MIHDHKRVNIDEDKSISEVRNNHIHGKHKKKKSLGQYQGDSSKISNCTYCSLTHIKGACPAFNKKCSYCGGKGHFAKCCFKAKKGREKVKVGSINCKRVESDTDSDDSCTLFAGAVATSGADDNDDWTINLNTNGTLINSITKLILERRLIFYPS